MFCSHFEIYYDGKVGGKNGRGQKVPSSFLMLRVVISTRSKVVEVVKCTEEGWGKLNVERACRGDMREKKGPTKSEV